jgi:hypothetical protein
MEVRHAEAKDHAIPLAHLRECFALDPATESGARWRFRLDMPPWWNTRYAGKPAARPDSEDYFPIKLTFDGRKRWLLAHRVVFALVH